MFLLQHKYNRREIHIMCSIVQKRCNQEIFTSHNFGHTFFLKIERKCTKSIVKWSHKRQQMNEILQIRLFKNSVGWMNGQTDRWADGQSHRPPVRILKNVCKIKSNHNPEYKTKGSHFSSNTHTPILTLSIMHSLEEINEKI